MTPASVLYLFAPAFLYQVLLGLVTQLRHLQSFSVEAVGCSFEGIYQQKSLDIHIKALTIGRGAYIF